MHQCGTLQNDTTLHIPKSEVASLENIVLPSKLLELNDSVASLDDLHDIRVLLLNFVNVCASNSFRNIEQNDTSTA